jgi:hypothetical protein
MAVATCGFFVAGAHGQTIRSVANDPYYFVAQEETQRSPSDVTPPTPMPMVLDDKDGGADGKDDGACQRDGCWGDGKCGGQCGTRGGCNGLLCWRTGDPWELFPENCRGWKIGGWFQAGYNNKFDGRFNTHPGRLHLHQAYAYVEKVADGECGLDWGFRTDLVYGVDAQDTQARGNNPGTWDFLNGFDYGIYGWALPQVYAELAYHDLSVKIGHFYRILGYESVMAPNNFFFSHAYTMNNSEPFTHTGAVARYQATDRLTAYGGWVLGWDTGYDQYNDGSAFLGGVAYSLTDNISISYMCLAGNLGWRSDGYNHSIVVDVDLTQRLKYVFQSDLVLTDGFYNVTNGVFTAGQLNDDVGINQYLIYEWNDCWAFGTRIEWWQRDGSSANEVAVGLNWKPIPNFILRPALRYDWGTEAVNQGVATKEVIFDIDGIITF